MEAVNQMVSMLILVLLVIFWLGIWAAISGLAILIYRVIRIELK